MKPSHPANVPVVCAPIVAPRLARRALAQCLPVLLVGAIAPPSQATITAIRGSAEALVQQVDAGINGDSDKAFDEFPATQAELPLQVVARLIAAGEDVAGAVVAAQFADPRLVAGPNPEEFAINLSLDSVSPDTRFVGKANATEIRDIVFNVGELGTQPAGTEVSLVGRLTIEGTMAMFSSIAGRDLTGARVSLLVTVTRQAADQIDQVVFSGNVLLAGADNGRVAVTTGGQFPSSTLILSDLGAITPGLFTLQALILPSIPINYEYKAVVGEPISLVATVQVDAENLPDNCGVAALIGTPTDLLQSVIAATKGEETAKSLLKSLADERANPSGVPAIPPPPPLLCGVFSIPTLLPMLIIPACMYRRRR